MQSSDANLVKLHIAMTPAPNRTQVYLDSYLKVGQEYNFTMTQEKLIDGTNQALFTLRRSDYNQLVWSQKTEATQFRNVKWYQSDQFHTSIGNRVEVNHMTVSTNCSLNNNN